jgi:hypothetical protein
MQTNFTANRITPAQMTKIITRLCSLEVNYEKFAWCSAFRSVPAPAPVPAQQQPSQMAILFVTLLLIFLAGAVCTYFVEPRAERYRRRRLIAGEWD